MEDSKTKVNEFDKYAINYRNVHNENIKFSGMDSDFFSEYKVKIVLENELASKNENIKILDLGCGDGNSIRYFSEYFPNANLIGLDVSSESIKNAIQKKISNSTFSVYNGSTIPYSSESFDIVFLAGVIHHIPINDRLNLIKETYRILKKNGRLYIFEHNPYNPITNKIVRDCIFDADAILISPTRLKRLLIKNGYIIERINFTIFFPRNKLFTYILKLESKLFWLPIGGQYFIKSNKNNW